jgi:hypothetical protein
MPFPKKVKKKEEKVKFIESYIERFREWGRYNIEDYWMDTSESSNPGGYYGPDTHDIVAMENHFLSLINKENIYYYYELISYLDSQNESNDELLNITYKIILSILCYLLSKTNILKKTGLRCTADDPESVNKCIEQIKLNPDYCRELEKIVNIDIYMRFLYNLLQLYYISSIIDDDEIDREIDFSEEINCSKYTDYSSIMIQLLEYKNTNYFIYSIKLLKYIIKYVNDKMQLVKFRNNQEINCMREINADNDKKENFNYYLSEKPLFVMIIKLSLENYKLDIQLQ